MVLSFIRESPKDNLEKSRRNRNIIQDPPEQEKKGPRSRVPSRAGLLIDFFSCPYIEASAACAECPQSIFVGSLIKAVCCFHLEMYIILYIYT